MPTAATTADIEALDAQARGLMATFARAGYERIEPAVIQPAPLFLDVIGEELRARTYVFTDPDGAELCLRPDLTVPTCRLHLERHPAGNVPARYCYSAPAFRYQAAGADRAHPREFRQAGIELFAAADREADDAGVLALTVEALRRAGLGRIGIRIGDLGLFAALIEALPMPQRWRARLRHQFWRPDAFRAELQRLTSKDALATGLPHDLVGAARSRRRRGRRARASGQGGPRADRHAHRGRDRRAPRRCRRGPAREAAAAGDGGADRELRRRQGAGAGDPGQARTASRVRRASTCRPGSTPSSGGSIASRRRASASPAASSPPSSAATSNTTRASCSRS